MQYARAAGGHAAAEIIKHALILAFAAAAALSLALSLDALWRDKIADNRRQHELRLLKETLSGAAYDRLVAADSSAFSDIPAPVAALWRVRRGGQTGAVAVRAHAEGYGGEIVFAAAFDLRGRLLQTRIVRHSETPGLADFLSLPDGGARAIDGVGGATITANAVARAARQIGAWIRYNAEKIDGGVD